jgi:hypothetical protein
MKDHDERIQELEREIEKLKIEKEELEVMPKNQRLAELLHSKQCRLAHEDQCGWYYEDWENPGLYRQLYLKKANDMLNKTSFEEVVKIVKLL